MFLYNEWFAIFKFSYHLHAETLDVGKFETSIGFENPELYYVDPVR